MGEHIDDKVDAHINSEDWKYMDLNRSGTLKSFVGCLEQQNLTLGKAKALDTRGFQKMKSHNEKVMDELTESLEKLRKRLAIILGFTKAAIFFAGLFTMFEGDGANDGAEDGTEAGAEDGADPQEDLFAADFAVDQF